MSPCQPAISTIISVITITETSPFNIVHTAVQMDKLINFLKKSFIKLRIENQLEQVRSKLHQDYIKLAILVTPITCHEQ